MFVTPAPIRPPLALVRAPPGDLPTMPLLPIAMPSSRFTLIPLVIVSIVSIIIAFNVAVQSSIALTCAMESGKETNQEQVPVS
jgi:hypothetical protein